MPWDEQLAATRRRMVENLRGMGELVWDGQGWEDETEIIGTGFSTYVMLGFGFLDTVGWNQEPEALSYPIVQGMQFGVNPFGVLLGSVPPTTYMLSSLIIMACVGYIVPFLLCCPEKTLTLLNLIFSKSYIDIFNCLEDLCEWNKV